MTISVTACVNNINENKDGSKICLSLLKHIKELKQFEYKVVREIVGYREVEQTLENGLN
jgi:hypothetical protein